MRSRPRRQRCTRARPATLDGVQALSHPFPHPAPSWWRIEMRACASPGPAGKKIPVAGCCSTQREGRARHSRAETHPPSGNDRLAPSSGPGRKATTRVASTIFFCLKGDSFPGETHTRKRDRGERKQDDGAESGVEVDSSSAEVLGVVWRPDSANFTDCVSLNSPGQRARLSNWPVSL